MGIDEDDPRPLVDRSRIGFYNTGAGHLSGGGGLVTQCGTMKLRPGIDEEDDDRPFLLEGWVIGEWE